jgi:hypothetical protein
MMKMKQAKPKPATKPEGLIGFFGHTYIPDPKDPDTIMIESQFEIIRTMDDARYVIQYFSWMDGDRTNVGVMTEAELLGPTVKLYATTELWLWAYEKEARRRGTWNRGADDD